MKALIHLIYSSTATPDFAEHAIPALLDHARERNSSQGLTGMLLYIEGNFFQVLEGEPAAVDAAFARIKPDPRHHRVTQIIREPILARDFGEWTMGYSQAYGDELGAALGENDFFGSASCLENLGPGRALKLLNAFRDGRWRAERTGMHRVRSHLA